MSLDDFQSKYIINIAKLHWIWLKIAASFIYTNISNILQIKNIITIWWMSCFIINICQWRYWFICFDIDCVWDVVKNKILLIKIYLKSLNLSCRCKMFFSFTHVILAMTFYTHCTHPRILFRSEHALPKIIHIICTTSSSFLYSISLKALHCAHLKVSASRTRLMGHNIASEICQGSPECGC